MASVRDILDSQQEELKRSNDDVMSSNSCIQEDIVDKQSSESVVEVQRSKDHLAAKVRLQHF